MSIVRCVAKENIYGMPMRGCAGITLHGAPYDQACGASEELQASCLHHEPQWEAWKEIEMANMDNLVKSVAAGGSNAEYWARISTLDEVTGKKDWTRRKYVVQSVNEVTREATVYVPKTGATAIIGEAKFKLLYKKPPRLPDEV